MKTKIEWADYTLNFWWGCAKVSEACRYCYAEGIALRLAKGTVQWIRGGKRWVRYQSAVNKLVKIKRAAGKLTDRKPRIFVNSMSDAFEENAVLDVVRCHMLVLLADTPECIFMLLTKRPENVQKMVPPAWLERGGWPAHVWIGTTVENQAAADERIPHLRKIPAAVRFLSCEPLLGPISFQEGGLPVDAACVADWIIIGGESGRNARPMHPGWARSLRHECNGAGVPFFFKQWGKWEGGPGCDDACGRCVQVFPDGARTGFEWEAGPHLKGAEGMHRSGKKAAGRLLDGREWNEVPVLRVPMEFSERPFTTP